jgi:hypothetical protein
VLVQWAYQYFTYQRGVRLITGTTAHRLLNSSRDQARERDLMSATEAVTRDAAIQYNSRPSPS